MSTQLCCCSRCPSAWPSRLIMPQPLFDMLGAASGLIASLILGSLLCMETICAIVNACASLHDSEFCCNALQGKSNVNVRAQGMTLLHVAAAVSKAASVKLLLSQKAVDINGEIVFSLPLLVSLASAAMLHASISARLRQYVDSHSMCMFGNLSQRHHVQKRDGMHCFRKTWH